MASKCDNLLQQALVQKGILDDAFQEIGRIQQQIGTDNIADLEELAERRFQVSPRIAGASKELDTLLQDANLFKCSQTIVNKIQSELNYGRNVFRESNGVGGQIQNRIDDLKVQKAVEEQKKAEAAAAKQNNSGNGVPGSAGTSSADQLTGVAVTGKRNPETVTNDPGAKSTPETLEEVSVTAKRSPETLEEVKVTGKKSDAELQPVTLGSTKRALPSETQAARSQAAQSDAVNYALKGDWRVRLGLAPGANYLYKAPDVQESILAPLAATDGIVFPYTPIINVSYLANYDSTAIQHSNYKVYQYQNSAVEQVTITCDFTAQSTQEANYMLAVIHFLRSVTKMFYGRDQNPIRGTPPPLCYLTGLGQYQFNAHPLLISGFTYNLPNDVDYIRAVMPASFGPTGNSIGDTPKATGGTTQQTRLGQGNPGQAGFGGNPNPAALSPNGSPGSTQPTYVPTKINIQISAYPVVPRAVASNDFSFKQYATGALLLGKNNSSGGGIW